MEDWQGDCHQLTQCSYYSCLLLMQRALKACETGTRVYETQTAKHVNFAPGRLQLLVDGGLQTLTDSHTHGGEAVRLWSVLVGL